jgi:hypothetical protein
MSIDDAIRFVAAAGAVALVVAPAGAVAWQKVRAFIAARAAGGKAEAAVSDRDMHTVLDLAARLKAAGCVDGVALCQQLLDVMLGNSPKGKR